ncbi:MAG: ankyrin repeat domain-containing protein [Parachlamydiaceae bacterium]|nr:ankyrin repeat domain-containing protein [Parachlamydiaceae bacterium]
MSIPVFVSSFNANKVNLLLEKAATPKGLSKLKVDEIIQGLMINLINKNLFVLREVIDPEKKSVWENIAKNMQKLAPDSIPQFNLLIKNIHVTLEQYQNIFKGTDTLNMNKAVKLILLALINENFDQLEIFSRLGANFNLPNSNGSTPLNYAILTGRPKVIEWLIKQHVDPNFFDAEGISPLLYAINQGKLEVIECLVKNGANPNFFDPEGFSPLLDAINQGKHEVIDYLVKNGANPNLLDSSGLTPLRYAIREGTLDMVERLLKNGANPNFIDPLEWSPLSYAIFKNKPEIVDCLLKNGANPNLLSQTNETPLAFAMAMDLPQMAEQLKAAGADEFYATQYIQQVFLAHTWGIEGSTLITDSMGEKRLVDFEGFKREIIMKKLSDLSKSFFQKKDYGKAIIEAIEKGYPNESLEGVLNSVKSGKSSILLGGTHDHCIGFAILKNKLCICNRGYGREEDSVEIFELPPGKVDEEFLKQITKSYKTIQLFKEAIKELNLTKIGGYRQKSQGVGNCTWASAKAAVGALCRLLTNDEEGKKDYKKFTEKCRKESLKDYLEFSKSPNLELLKSIELKAKGKKNQLWAQNTLAVVLKGERSYRKRAREENPEAST